MNQFQKLARWKAAGLAGLTSLALGSPALAQSKAAPREGVPTISGYMEMHFNKVENQPAEIDFHRFVLMVGHSFTDRLKFWSEVEIEHAFVAGGEEGDGGGEVALEQAYIDLLVHPRFNLRAGMVLVPVGLINERHEPPTFNGVERPLVDTFVVPTTWHDTGAGAFGDLGRGFSYRAYVLPGLDATGFSAKDGIAEGRQQGSHATMSNPAVTGRLEYRRRGLTAGASAWRGGSSIGLARLDIEKPTVSVQSIDARYRHGRHELRGQISTVDIDGAGDLNRALQARSGTNPNIASQLFGAYGEASSRISPNSWSHEVVAFGRYEKFETQRKMPNGFLPLDQFNRAAWVVGATYYPDPDVAFKWDTVWESNKSSVVRGHWSINLGVGWWF